MKKRTPSLIFIPLLGMVLTGCTPANSDKGPVDPSGDTYSFETIKTKVVNNHNYSAHILSKYVDKNETLADYNLYNISNNVIYDDADADYYYGYIKQKNQGIVNFRSPKQSQGIVIGDLVATNTSLGMSDIYPIALEYVLDKTFTKKEGTNNTYVSTNFTAMAVIGNLAFGNHVIWASAPENFTVTLLSDSSFKIEARFLYNYQAAEEGDIDDTFVQTPVDVTIEATKLGTTSNSLFEGYVANPDYTFQAPTVWDDDAREYFNEYFNREVPPFIEGLTYAWKIYDTLIEGKYYIGVEDYNSGDLTNSYSQALVGNGYTLTSGKYVKVVDDQSAHVTRTYSIELHYLAPTEKDSDGMEYGFLYPNGVFYALYRYEEQSTVTVANVRELNAYLATTAVKDYLPQLNVNADTRVTGFKDTTGASNNSGNGDIYAFVAPNRTSYFNVHIESKYDALNFVESYKAEFEKLGYNFDKAFGMYSGVDDYGSIVRFTDVSGIDTTTWERIKYVQIDYVILKTSVAAHGQDTDRVLNSISVSGATVDFYQNSEFKFDGVVTAHYTNGTSRTVQPTSVSTPNMSQLGSQDVTVTYTENNVTKTTTYSINVQEKASVGDYTLTVAVVAGITFDSVKIDGSSKRDYNEGALITFKVILSEGYTLNKLYYTLNGQEVEITQLNPMTNVYSFYAPAGSITLTASVTYSGGGSQEGTDSFSGVFLHETSSSGTFKFTFSDDNTGIYSYINGLGQEKFFIHFSYTYDKSTGAVSITINTEDFDLVDDYTNKFRLTNYKAEAPAKYQNTSGVLNGNNFSINLYSISAGVVSQNTEATVFSK